MCAWGKVTDSGQLVLGSREMLPWRQTWADQISMENKTAQCLSLWPRICGLMVFPQYERSKIHPIKKVVSVCDKHRMTQDVFSYICLETFCWKSWRQQKKRPRTVSSNAHSWTFLEYQTNYTKEAQLGKKNYCSTLPIHMGIFSPFSFICLGRTYTFFYI